MQGDIVQSIWHLNHDHDFDLIVRDLVEINQQQILSKCKALTTTLTWTTNDPKFGHYGLVYMYIIGYEHVFLLHL